MVKPPKTRKFKYISKLGEGGMSTVYLAIQEKLNRKVAVKILESSLLKGKKTEARFVKEARTAANLQHSNIIQIFDISKIGDYYCIVMEYLEETLRDRMERYPQGRMHPEIALDIIEEILNALDYAHLKGVFHRDIKPENIMFRHDSTPVLVDFGIASVFGSTDNLTGNGQSMGTADYMSPEQARAKKDIDGRSDIYSLGAVLFEMLSGEKPYKGKAQVSVILQQIEKPAPRLPQELSRYQPLIDKMMAKDRKKRFSTGAQIVVVLDRILTGSGDSTSTPAGSSPSQAAEPPHYQEEDFTPSLTEAASEAHLSKKKGEQYSTIKQLFTYCFESCKDFANSFKAYSPKKKAKTLGLGVLAVIVLVVILNLLSSGNDPKNKEAFPIRESLAKEKAAAEKQAPLSVEKNSRKQQSEKQKHVEQKPGEKKSEELKPADRKPAEQKSEKQEPGERKSQKQKPLSPEEEKQFQEKYTLARQYIEKKDFEKANPLIMELKNIKDTEGVKDLEKKISPWRDAGYNRYIEKAYAFIKRKNYFNAKICIIQAKQYKTTLELKTLETSVDDKLKKRRRKR